MIGILEGVFAVGFLLVIVLVNKLQIQVNIYITVFLYLLLFNTMLFLLKNPYGQYGKTAGVARDMANFMYYSHPMFMLGINKVMSFLAGRSATGTEMFLLAVVSTGSIGYLLHKADNKYLNKLFK